MRQRKVRLSTMPSATTLISISRLSRTRIARSGVYSVKPTATSTSIPDTIGKEYRETIVHGALYRLQTMAGQPFADIGGIIEPVPL